MDLTDYRHKVSVRVRTFEVDSQGIVHNINYLKYLEIGRVEYRRNMGYKILPNGIFNDGLKVVVVRNEIDYLSYSYLDDLLDIYTKISWIKNSSFCFEQIVQRNSDMTAICTASGILVNINSQNNSEKLPLNFINQIKDFEKNLRLI
ncbi:MAG TPA: acyl-CoA thioesterase [Ignavibacteria bacterium]|nr:acyl-CoA thioesterase [Ignavibacteria bacterium]HMR39203.1 acyl-CoA thioesterase [Ignavibacteria bacterium]